MDYLHWVEKTGQAIDVLGVVVIVIGTTASLARYVAALVRRTVAGNSYALARQRIGKSILLGLELLVAGDIIRTVATTPTFTSVTLLAVIVLIRTFLSWAMQLEIEGRWPWQPRPPSLPPSP